MYLRNIYCFCLQKLFFLMISVSAIQCVGMDRSSNNTNNTNTAQSTPELVATFGRGSYNTEGEVNFPSGITVDSDGNVYVCNDVDAMITKFDGEGNFITRWWVKDCFNLEADNENNIYVASKLQHKIIKYDSNGVIIKEWGSYGNDDGEFNEPNDVAINNSLGLVYVADSRNLRIQVFDTDGTFKFKWGSEGSGDGQFTGPRGPLGIAVDQITGAVYVADSEALRIQKFDKDGNFLLKWGSAGKNEGEMRWPRDIEVDSQGHVYEADTDNERIQVFDPYGNLLMVIKGEPDTFTTRCFTHNSHLDCTALHNEVDGPLHPRAVAVDPVSGDIFVAATYAQRIDKFDSSGNFLKTWGWWEKGNGVFNRPSGMTIDNLNGYVYIVDTHNFLIQKFDTDGNFVTSWGHSGRVSTIFDGGDGSFDFPHAITVDNKGNIYVLRSDSYYEGDPELRRVQKFDKDGNFLLSWNYTDYIGQEDMEGIVYNPYSDTICVSNSPDHKVQCFYTNGTFLFEFGEPGSGNGQFYWPAKSAVDPVNGDMYVIDSGNSLIQKFTSNGNFITKWGRYGTSDGEFRIDSYSGIYVDNEGYVYIADSGNRRIQVFDSDGNFVLKWSGFNNPTGISVDSSGYVYVLDKWRQEVYKFAPVQK
jgi:DNA-binding beta-propeller fold protein YncE